MRVLFLNTFLLSGAAIKAKCRVAERTFARVEDKPARKARARELGTALASESYDLIALCEVFESGDRDRILRGWEVEPDFAEGPSADTLPPTPAVPSPIPCPSTFFGGPQTAKIKLGERANSGLLTMSVGQPILDTSLHTYRSRGEPLKDIDFWASKGVLRIVVDLGVGKVEIFSTHLHSGGDLPPPFPSPSKSEKEAVRRAQIEELCFFIDSFRDDRPSDMIGLVVGDFNRPGPPDVDSGEADLYEELSGKMAEVDMEDLWMARARDGDGGIAPGPTKVDVKAGSLGLEGVCRPVSDSGGVCDDRILPADDQNRIDYVFVEKQKPEHGFGLDVTRPLRMSFPRDEATENIDQLSDHLGLAFTLVASPLM